MQAPRSSVRDGPARRGVDGLVRLLVALARLLARDVRRQRRNAEMLDLLHVAGKADHDGPFLFLPTSAESVAENVTHRRFTRLADCTTSPLHRIALAREQELDRFFMAPFGWAKSGPG